MKWLSLIAKKTEKITLTKNLTLETSNRILSHSPAQLDTYFKDQSIFKVKVEEIIRDEMNKSGAVEAEFPILQPKELWEIKGIVNNVCFFNQLL